MQRAASNTKFHFGPKKNCLRSAPTASNLQIFSWGAYPQTSPSRCVLTHMRAYTQTGARKAGHSLSCPDPSPKKRKEGLVFWATFLSHGAGSNSVKNVIIALYNYSFCNLIPLVVATLVAQYRDSKKFLGEIITWYKCFNGYKGSTVICHTQGMKHYHTEGDRLSYVWLWVVIVICGYIGLWVVM